MKLFLLLLGLGLAHGYNLDGLRVTYGPLPNVTEYFIKMPRTIEAAECEGWQKTARAPGPLEQLQLYCTPGYYLCLYYAPSGFVSGLQIAFPSEDLYTAVIDKNKWFTRWTPAEGDVEHLAISQYWVSEELLAKGGPTEENGETLQDAGVWVYDHSGELMLIPRTEKEIQRTKFTKQNCTPRMGTHYHYNMTREMLCENQLPWFGLMMEGKLMGSGMQMFGKLWKPPTYKQFFEPFWSRETEMGAVPNGPECLYELADSPDHVIFSLHIYFRNDPENVVCKLSDSANPSTIPKRG